jgi:hypothetical protein
MKICRNNDYIVVQTWRVVNPRETEPWFTCFLEVFSI